MTRSRLFDIGVALGKLALLFVLWSIHGNGALLLGALLWLDVALLVRER